MTDNDAKIPPSLCHPPTHSLAELSKNYKSINGADLDELHKVDGALGPQTWVGWAPSRPKKEASLYRQRSRLLALGGAGSIARTMDSIAARSGPATFNTAIECHSRNRIAHNVRNSDLTGASKHTLAQFTAFSQLTPDMQTAMFQCLVGGKRPVCPAQAEGYFRVSEHRETLADREGPEILEQEGIRNDPYCHSSCGSDATVQGDSVRSTSCKTEGSESVLEDIEEKVDI